VIIAVEQVSHSYGKQPALKGLSLHSNARDVFGILGPNGGGKSTLFKILSTLLIPNEGQVEVCGFNARKLPHEIRRRIGVVFQSNSLDKQLTVEENLVAQGHLYGLSGVALDQRLRECLGRLGLYDRRRDLVKTLSGGLARRVEIAKALLHRPQVVLMDEPSTGLDPAARRELWTFIDGLRQDHGLTVLLTTHLLDEAERCDRLMLIHQGLRVAEGSPAELKSIIGGEVVEFEPTGAPADLARAVSEAFAVKAVCHDGHVRVETAAAHRLAAEAVERLPGRIRGVHFHQPTLEDVFLLLTGARLC
jgi:ABC-2 type transport system ATP-binding protein